MQLCTKPIPDSFDEVLVDGDMVVFSIAAAVEYGKEITDVNFDDISNSIDSKLKYLAKRLGARKLRVFFSHDVNFRYAIDPSYKMNRADSWRPHHLKAAKAHVMAHWEGECEHGLEADDLITMNMKPDGSTIACTLDKDIPQNQGWYYRWETQHHGEDFQWVDQAGILYMEQKQTTKGIKKEIKGNGSLFFLYQLLIGDPTDGVLGCGQKVEKMVKSGAKAGQMVMRREGYGPVEAYQLINGLTPGQAFQKVAAAYKIIFGEDEWETKMLQQARLVHMVKEPLIDGKIAQLWYYKKSQRESAQFDLSAGIFVNG